MPRYICHYKGYFFEWSTVVDAPVSYAMKRTEFERFYDGDDLNERLERAIKYGTSCHTPQSLEELVSCNRAGPRESHLSFKKVLKRVGIKDKKK